LETKAIDPFINSMSPEDQNALKKQLSERMFGQFSNMEYDKTKVLDEHAVSVVLEALFKKFKSS
jgi:predicted metal-binding transcription factor (methanogenesis marker protein 9)